ncbi:hypothetical protein ANN_15761 [Periplaneta americana]|uniref:Reverse transcriptase domain-containing protein n=1 Tax=Periplaneta americana TaxID=6978 RepID=A0ABQ8SHD5_PERAM|nr:hypothetical protein ANN_15761 [Periplaneta americana]
MSMRRCDGMVLLVLFHDESVCSDYGGKKGYLASESDEGDNAGEMSPGSSICSYWVEGKPRKKPQPGNLPRPGIEPGPPCFAARRANRYSTGVDPGVFVRVRQSMALRCNACLKSTDVCSNTCSDETVKQWIHISYLTLNIYNLYNQNEITIQTERETSNWVPINQGVRQGCGLSPLLFIIYMNHILKIWRQGHHAGIQINRNTCLDTLLFADDQLIIAKTEDELQRAVHNL